MTGTANTKGGFTFLKPQSFTAMSKPDFKLLLTNKNSVMVVLRLSGNNQKCGIFKQLSEYKSVPLGIDILQYNNMWGDFVNMRTNLFVQFVPKTYGGIVVNGLKVNGKNLNFTNCDWHINSYISVYPFGAESESDWSGDIRMSDLADRMITAAEDVPQSAQIPEDYIMFLQMVFGGCGCITFSFPGDPAGITGGAIGIH